MASHGESGPDDTLCARIGPGAGGGMNITDDQNDRLNAAAYRDLHLRVEGKEPEP